MARKMARVGKCCVLLKLFFEARDDPVNRLRMEIFARYTWASGKGLAAISNGCTRHAQCLQFPDRVYYFHMYMQRSIRDGSHVV